MTTNRSFNTNIKNNKLFFLKEKLKHFAEFLGVSVFEQDYVWSFQPEREQRVLSCVPVCVSESMCVKISWGGIRTEAVMFDIKALTSIKTARSGTQAFREEKEKRKSRMRTSE